MASEQRVLERRKARGSAVFKQRFKVGSWKIVDLSEGGLRATGPLNGLDPDKPVDVRVQIGRRHFIARLRHRWSRGQRHGWQIASIRTPSRSQLLGILLESGTRRASGSPQGARFGRLLGGLPV